MSLANVLGVPVRRRPPPQRYGRPRGGYKPHMRGTPGRDGPNIPPIIGGGFPLRPILPLYKTKPPRYS